MAEISLHNSGLSSLRSLAVAASFLAVVIGSMAASAPEARAAANPVVRSTLDELLGEVDLQLSAYTTLQKAIEQEISYTKSNAVIQTYLKGQLAIVDGVLSFDKTEAQSIISIGKGLGISVSPTY